jgi:VWFA-related protein
MRIPFWLPGLILGLAARVPSAASPPEPYYGSVDVRVANVEVFVTDRGGNPVPGLTKDDFELSEGGRKLGILYFSSQQQETAEAKSVAAGVTAAEEAPPPVGTERTFAVFLDARNLEANTRRMALAALTRAVEGLSSRDRFVLIDYDLRIRSARSFSGGDRAAILAALAERAGTSGFENRAEIEQLLRRLESARATSHPALADTVKDDMRTYCQRRLGQVESMLAALQRTVEGLAGLPGHKALIYVTGNLSLRPWEEFFPMDSESFRWDASAALQRVVAAANAGRVTVYPLGLPTDRSVTSGTSAAPQNRPDSPYLAALIDLASGTGGQFVLDPVSPAVLPAFAVRDLATFYSLGYEPPSQGKEGQIRRIRVKVKRPGLEVRYRRTFRTRSGIEETRDRTLAALLVGETRNPLGIEVELGAVRPGARGNLEVEMTVSFPIERLTLLPVGELQQGEARLFVGSRSGRGETSDLTEIAIPVRVPRDRLAETSKRRVGFKTHLQLRPEPCQVVIGVRDVQGNADSTVLVPWSPPARTEK